MIRLGIAFETGNGLDASRQKSWQEADRWFRLATDMEECDEGDRRMDQQGVSATGPPPKSAGAAEEMTDAAPVVGGTPAPAWHRRELPA